jgi:hypothetical protein
VTARRRHAADVGWRKLAGLLGASGLAATTGCAVQVDGSFGDLAFAPTQTAVAILDEHDVLVRDGALLPVARGQPAKRVHVWLSSAPVDTGVDWRFLEPAQLAELRTRLSLSDLLVVRDLNFDALGDGDTLTAIDDGGTRSGEFVADVGTRALSDAEQALIAGGLGARVTVTARAALVEDGQPRGGRLQITLDVEREATARQSGNDDVVTGSVTLDVDVPFAPERLAEANLAVVAPIARCSALAGPAAAGRCADEPSLPVLDETGEH